MKLTPKLQGGGASCPHHESIERIGLQGGSDDLVARLHAHRQLLTKLILHHDDDALVRVNKRQQVVVTGPTPDIQTLRAWPNKMAEVLEQVVLEVVPERLRLRIDRDQGVLRPSPPANPALFEGDIPVVVNAGPVAQVMLHQRPSVAAIAPVVFAVPALLLGLVKC